MFNCFAANNNSQGDATLNVQTTHGLNVIKDQESSIKNATTVFVSDSAVVSSQEQNLGSTTLQLAKSSVVENVQDIKSFLAKPIILQTGVISTTDTVSTFSAIPFMATYLTNVLVADKLRGYFGIRATIVIRVILNANRFQQGLYQFSWVPVGGQANGNQRTLFYDSHIATRVQRSQLHRVELDVNCDTEGELVIPYSSSLNWVPLRVPAGSAGELGIFRVFPYVPLTAPTGSTTASFRIYAHLEDVELLGAAVPQMGRKLSRVIKKNASEIEAKNANIGPVESAMAMGATISNALSVVPMLTPFAKPASWVFEAMSGLAASFGWSKPANLAPAARMVQNFAPYMGSVNNDDYALPLSLDVKNYVEPLPLGITYSDEMDFSALCAIFSWKSTLSWSTSDSVGATIFSYNITPTLGTLVTGTNYHFSPLALLANLFNYWRGGFIFKIKIVKTEFHSGRISLNFNPVNSVGSGGGFILASAPYLNRTIYDIRECNQILYHVPYTSALPYLSTSDEFGKSLNMGQLVVVVEDILTAPSAVSPTINLVVEICGDKDFEFAYPREIKWNPSIGAVPEMGDKLIRNDCSLEETGSSLVASDQSLAAASMCMGERVRSLRSMVKTYNSLNPLTVPAAGNFWNILPFVAAGRFGGATPVEPAYQADLWSLLHGCFLYSRGGVRLMIHRKDTTADSSVTNAQDLLTVVRYMFSYPANSVPTLITASAVPANGINVKTNGGLKLIGRTSGNQPVQAFVSALNPSVARLCGEYLTHPGALGKFGTADQFSLAVGDRVTIGPTNADALPRNYIWYRAGADDCDFSQFISIVPMSRSTVI